MLQLRLTHRGERQIGGFARSSEIFQSSLLQALKLRLFQCSLLITNVWPFNSSFFHEQFRTDVSVPQNVAEKLSLWIYKNFATESFT